MHIGVVVNPIAGMGGRVGLKGTDDKVEEARERGATPRAPERATRALEALHSRDPNISVTAGPGEMGAAPARRAGYEPTVVSDIDPASTEEPATTDRSDTRTVVKNFVGEGVDVILFVGGDGTATDVAETLDDLDDDTPMLGVPAGVKVYSSVFSVTPEEAASVLVNFEDVEDREVNDIDEEAYRGGEVHTSLRAVRPVPIAEGIQSSKQIGGGSVEAIARGVKAEVEAGRTYILGPGSTVGAIKDQLGIDGSPLGVDVWRATEDGSDEEPAEGELLVTDATEEDILENLGDDNVIIVSPIGGQGFVFGRGNHQISPAVIKQSEVQIVASPAKLDDLDVLRVDIDDPAVSEELTGWDRARMGRVDRRMMKIE